jgi:hypothetical protein
MKAYWRRKYWLVFVSTVLLSVAAYANPAKDEPSAAPASRAAETSNVANQTSDSNQPDNSQKSAGSGAANLPNKNIKSSKNGLDNARETSGYVVELVREPNWPQRIIRGAKESLLRPDNLTILLLAGGASIALDDSGADEKIADNFKEHHIFHGFTDESLDVGGNPLTHLGASAVWYAVSRKNHDDLNAERAESMLTALAVTDITTVALKGIRDNDSPNGKRWAWPSGHTASSFTVASMLDEYYGPKVGLPSYALASLVAYRMLDTGDHWTSDVVFGAALGWVVGHTFGAKQRRLEVAGFEVLPYTASNSGSVIGVNFVKKF